MKDVILGVHTGRNDDRMIRYWEYTKDTNHLWNYDTAEYAIVETNYGYQMVKVVGIAQVKDEVEAEKKVVSFLDNSEFPKEKKHEEDAEI